MDRLEEIKNKYLLGKGSLRNKPGSHISQEEIKWLIKEVGRLRKKCQIYAFAEECMQRDGLGGNW